MWRLLCLATLVSLSAACSPSATQVSGKFANAVCSGQLVFSEEFNEFNLEKWQHEISLAGGGNWEFQYYNNNRTNSFVRDGRLFIRPSLTADQYGEAFLTSGTLNVNNGADKCTNPSDWGCERTGTPTNVLNPVKSARIHTVGSFSFRYGRVEVRAKTPAGDWLWPAVWMMPAENTYGSWPASGEIDLLESRGNRALLINGANIGTQQTEATLHYGPKKGINGWERAHWVKKDAKGYNSDFHRYQLEWTPDFLKFSIDDVEFGRIAPPAGGFWEHGGFDRNIPNPWRSGTKMAPFDQKFFIIINLAVGGNNYFPDSATNPSPKPWKNGSPTSMTDFWKGRNGWLPTWNLGANDGQDASLQVDYVRVWAL